MHLHSVVFMTEIDSILEGGLPSSFVFILDLLFIFFKKLNFLLFISLKKLNYLALLKSESTKDDVRLFLV